MELLFAICLFISAVAWAVVMAACVPGAHRVVMGYARRYDLLAVLLLGLGFNRVGYALVRYIWWQPSDLSDAELGARSILALLMTALALFSWRVLRQYRHHEVLFR